MQAFGKLLIVFGFVTIVLGVILLFFDKIPLIGKLPGDINIKKDNFQFYFPITSSLVLSIIISLILWLVSLISRK
ncbi:MAG: DUF2905 domain-containing protein [Ignavibacteriales bacterium]|nr:DUF2905 domain-containing protein [Ignavibacteriales bacterium]